MRLEEYIARRKDLGERGVMQELADKVPVTVATISRWASGSRKPRPKHVTALVVATNGAVTREELRPDIYIE